MVCGYYMCFNPQAVLAQYVARTDNMRSRKEKLIVRLSDELARRAED